VSLLHNKCLREAGRSLCVAGGELLVEKRCTPGGWPAGEERAQWASWAAAAHSQLAHFEVFCSGPKQTTPKGAPGGQMSASGPSLCGRP